MPQGHQGKTRQARRKIQVGDCDWQVKQAVGERMASQLNAGDTPCARAVLVGLAGQSCEAVVGPAAVQWPHQPEQKKHMAVPKRANAAKPAGRQGAANTGTSPACRSFQEDHRPGDAGSDRKQSLRLFILEEELLSSCSRTGQRAIGDHSMGVGELPWSHSSSSATLASF